MVLLPCVTRASPLAAALPAVYLRGSKFGAIPWTEPMAQVNARYMACRG